MSVTVRKQLTDSGWQGVARYGRWDTQGESVMAIAPRAMWMAYCSCPTIGSKLADCTTRKTAYAIDGSPDRGVGLDEMVKRLMRYLRGEPVAPPEQKPGAPPEQKPAAPPEPVAPPEPEAPPD